MPVGAYSQDLVTRIINVHWGAVEQQGLLAEYPPGPGAPVFENVGLVMKGTPTAYALGSGTVFEGVNMGASGLGHTVLTRGLVCFGKPRSGPACFIACPDFTYYDDPASLQRGTLNDHGVLVWNDTGESGAMRALTFAGNAFFAVYADQSIATSFDGITWGRSAAVEDDETAGAVASILRKTDAVPPQLYRMYISVGEVLQGNDEIQNTIGNLVYSTSDTSEISAPAEDEVEWNSSFEEGVTTDPGTSFVRGLNNLACTAAAGRIPAVPGVSDAKDILVAPAGKKRTFEDPRTGSVFVQMSTASAVSEDGESWSTSPATGALPAGLDQRSWGLATVYIKTSADAGYFLMTDHELAATGAPKRSSLYNSSDGRTWSKIKTNINWMATLSAIARDLDSTTIVRI